MPAPRFPEAPAAEGHDFRLQALSPSSLRLLVVDDHEDTRIVMSRLLAARGHVVTEAASIAQALARYAEGEFDLIISDLGLPDGSGNDLMVQLQERRPIKGIALSGYGMEADLVRSRAAGFDLHLVKPVDFDRLEAAIQAARPLSAT